jgi:hypothetical protein
MYGFGQPYTHVNNNQNSYYSLYTGPRILGRERPVQQRVRLYGKYGRAADPWWRCVCVRVCVQVFDYPCVLLHIAGGVCS